MSLKEAIKECYASNPVDVYDLDCLELLHPKFIDEQGRVVSVRAVIAYEEWQFTHEPDAPLDPGAVVTYYPIPFQFTPMGFEDDKVPSLTFSISNVTRQISTYLELAIEDITPITLIYRQYLNTDTLLPQNDPVVVMQLTNVATSATSATGTATLSDVHNWPFPWQRYTPKRFPGLV